MAVFRRNSERHFVGGSQSCVKRPALGSNGCRSPGLASDYDVKTLLGGRGGLGTCRQEGEATATDARSRHDALTLRPSPPPPPSHRQRAPATNKAPRADTSVAAFLLVGGGVAPQNSPEVRTNRACAVAALCT